MTDDEWGHVRWFGPTWHAAVCDPDYEIPVPVGEPCVFCTMPLEADAQGVSMASTANTRVPAHVRCLMQNVIGRTVPTDNPFLA